MTDAMAGCHVLRDVKSSSLLLLQFQDVKGRRRGSGKVRIVSGRFGSCLTIGRVRSALNSSEAVALPLISPLRGIKSLSISRHSLCRRGHAPLKNVVAKDFFSPEDGNASILEPSITSCEIRSSLEFGLQLIYLGTLLALLAVGSFLVVRKVLIRRDLESDIKELQDRVRSGEASSEEFFELGAVMLRKKYYVLANKYLEQAIKKWDGDEADLTQVYNELGFSYFRDNKLDAAINLFEKAVKLRPVYVIAWYNLGNVYEVKKDFKNALKSYEEALQFDPNNKIAQRRRDAMKERVDRFRDIPAKD